jgi:hypothetical protein
MDREKPDHNSCYLNTIVLEDGTRMDRYGQDVKAPDGIRARPAVAPRRPQQARRGGRPASRTSPATGPPNNWS